MAKISIADLIINNKLYPLFWGMNEEDFINILPNSESIIQELKALQYPFLIFDDIEFYFNKENNQELCEIIIQAHSIKPCLEGIYFEFEWINNTLTYYNTKRKLIELGWPFIESFSKFGKTPLLQVGNQAIFAFYNDSEKIADSELCKIIIRRDY